MYETTAIHTTASEILDGDLVTLPAFPGDRRPVLRVLGSSRHEPTRSQWIGKVRVYIEKDGRHVLTSDTPVTIYR